MFTSWMISSRVEWSSARTLIRAISRRMQVFSSRMRTVFTGSSLRHWAASSSMVSSSVMISMEMRVTPGRSVAPETMDSML